MSDCPLRRRHNLWQHLRFHDQCTDLAGHYVDQQGKVIKVRGVARMGPEFWGKEPRADIERLRDEANDGCN